MQKQTPLQELIEFMSHNVYRGNAIVYGKVLELLEKEQEELSEAFNNGRHNAKYVLTTAPITGIDYYNKTYGKLNVDI
jgi:hypothetical protein